MANIHKDCEHYVPENDMCMLYFQLGFFNVSKEWPNECVDHFAFAESEESFTEVK